MRLSGAMAGVLLAACSESASYVFSGRLYETARGCLDQTTSIDVITGKPPGPACTRACLVGTDNREAGGSAVYVSTMCAPFPPGFDATETAAVCAPALDAYDRNDTCLPDGGSSHPPPDAGHD